MHQDELLSAQRGPAETPSAATAAESGECSVCSYGTGLCATQLPNETQNDMPPNTQAQSHM